MANPRSVVSILEGEVKMRPRFVRPSGNFEMRQHDLQGQFDGTFFGLLHLNWALATVIHVFLIGLRSMTIR
jgi:hypothetical protein